MQNIHGWLAYNSIKANPDKFQLIILGKQARVHCKLINGITIKPSSFVTLLGVIIDSKLNFRKNISIILYKKHTATYVALEQQKFFNIRKKPKFQQLP